MKSLFKKIFKWRKTIFITSKEELLALSDAEKGLVDEHRKKMIKLERSKILVGEESMRISNMYSVTPETDKIEYLYDFNGGWHAGNNTIVPMNNLALTANGEITFAGMGGNTITGGADDTIPMDLNMPPEIIVRDEQGNEQKIGKIIAVKPKDVVAELERVPGPDMIENIDAKIMVLKNKKELLVNNSYSNHELIDMCLRLENRKKWEEYKEFYGQFENTTSQKIQDLGNKYNLVLKGSDLFISAFPDEAIAIMKEYKEQTIKLCGKQPYFYAIAEAKNFKSEYEKKDPILLVQSPFGAYWQILGAYDEEMILLEFL